MSLNFFGNVEFIILCRLLKFVVTRVFEFSNFLDIHGYDIKHPLLTKSTSRQLVTYTIMTC